MGTHTAYRLTFKTQLHLGRATGAAQQNNLGLEKTEVYIPTDTLFSAICQTWAMFYGAEDLTGFLNCYTTDNTELPFTLTSAFPFADDVYFFPKPLTWVDSSKESKRVQFVSQSIFQNIISGNPPQFTKDQVINGEKVWLHPDERTRLPADPTVWQTNTRPRVSVDRQTTESDIWHIETVQFNKGCGLWFAVQFDSDETKQRIETLLRALGDNGIGGERNAGYGLFDFVETKIEIPMAETGNQFVTLSPICPKSPEQLVHLLTGDIAYTLNPSAGWMSPPGPTSQRKRVMMFAEGSVLNAIDGEVGRLIDVKPDTWHHPVYRYGYAWQVTMNGEQQ